MGNRGLIYKLSLATLVAIYLVILAGSVVRMTGSGMGCPDWPKCFGQWIPPTDISELPEDYEADYLAMRKTKLDKYIGLIEAIGLPQVAYQMRQDPSLLASEPFDARGTWIEYVNRLFGFLSGNFMLALSIVSLWWFRRDKWIPFLAFLSLITIGFQAWLGSVVVATNLLPWTVTIHMVGAFVIIALIIALIKRLPALESTLVFKHRYLMGLALVLTLIQVVLGTQVRQEIDELARQGLERSSWIAGLTIRFEIHRTFSILLLLINGSFLYTNRGLLEQSFAAQAVMVLLAAEVLLGIILAYGDMPSWAQPSHLLLATGLFGAQCWCVFNRKEGLKQA